MVAMVAGELVEKGLGHAAVKINDAVFQQTNEALIRDAVKKLAHLTSDGVKRAGSLPLIVESSTRQDVYGNDFGWEKPVVVRTGVVSKREGFVSLLPVPKGGDAIHANVCLPQEILEAMEYEADFVEALIYCQ